MTESYYIRRDRFIQRLLTDPETKTPAATRDIGILLATMCTPDNPIARPSRAWLANKTGHAVRSVERAVATLKVLGYFKVISGGKLIESNTTFTSRYEPLFNIADEFNLGEEFPVPSPLAARTVSSGGFVPSPVADESVRMSRSASGTSAGAPVPPRPDEGFGNIKTGYSTDEADYNFNKMWGLAGNFGKAGNAGKKAVLKGYRVALEYPGVTEQGLYDGYADHLTKHRGKRYTGHILLKWLNDPENYIDGSMNGNPVAPDQGISHSAKESVKPAATGGLAPDAGGENISSKSKAIADKLLIYIGWDEKILMDLFNRDEQRLDDFYEFSRLMCGTAINWGNNDAEHIATLVKDPDRIMTETAEASWETIYEWAKNEDDEDYRFPNPLE